MSYFCCQQDYGYGSDLSLVWLYSCLDLHWSVLVVSLVWYESGQDLNRVWSSNRYSRYEPVHGIAIVFSVS